MTDNRTAVSSTWNVVPSNKNDVQRIPGAMPVELDPRRARFVLEHFCAIYASAPTCAISQTDRPT